MKKAKAKAHSSRADAAEHQFAAFLANGEVEK